MSSKFYTRFSHSPIIGFECKTPSLTVQSFAYETDINNIVKGCISSLPPNTQRPTFNSSFSPDSYNEALNLIASAKSQFESLPSHIRQQFDNNPAKLLEFVQDDKNYDKAVELGLIDKKVVSNDTTAFTVIPEASADGINQASSD